ncbi:hypothetical protein ACGF1Z_31060 [Streptomyces sp. NPDC048018]|uniref:hypothetical protein n=1 Tax=Streptomyces sp. NPDC048018 TaxID=3365499 RepID=UPI00371EFAEC
MRGKAKKKLQVPPSRIPDSKRIGDPSNLLPGGQDSSDRVSWRFTHVDHESRWGFNRMEASVLCEVLTKLAGCESMTLNELRTSRRLFKEYELPSGLCKEALDRLAATGRDDQSRIHRLQFTGTQRLYGFLQGSVFHVVWWDPDHEVYPTSPRNT